jgi:hypothetical protein
LVASNIIQYWTAEKVLYLEDEGEDMREIIFNPLDMQDLEYDIKISAGSMAGVDKDQFNLFATSLLNTNRITFSQYADIVDIPKAQQLKKFAAENDEVAAQVQELQMQSEQMQQESAAMIQSLQQEILKLKAIKLPAILMPTEQRDAEAIIKQEQYDDLMGVNEDQPDTGVI